MIFAKLDAPTPRKPAAEGRRAPGLWRRLTRRVTGGGANGTEADDPGPLVEPETPRLAGLDERLMREAGLSEEDIRDVRKAARKRKKGGSLVRILTDRKNVPIETVRDILSRTLGLPVLSRIEDGRLDAALVADIPIRYLRRNLCLPFRGEDGGVLLAVNDPLRTEVRDDLRQTLGLSRLDQVIAPMREILSAINRTYGKTEARADAMLRDLDRSPDAALYLEALDRSGQDLLDETSSAPIIKGVNEIIAQAIKSGASDIHIEPAGSELKVRYRLDGILHTRQTYSMRLHRAVISRIKIMARLDIAETRLPQDGRIELTLGSRMVDIRVSTLPTASGERAVLRLLEKSATVLGLDSLGLAPEQLREFRRTLTLPNGMILVTGPTGSGKTTTLYAALGHINSPDKNILTIEDPVEYQIEGIGQMQVNAKIELTFAKGLRSMVRQDPDVIMVGEIRDGETAEIAIQAALTGHLVFSTLHTNDAPSAVTRLFDMGVEPFQIAASVRALVAQRLVRVLCPACKAAYRPPREELAELGLEPSQVADPLFRPVGCQECLGIGYRGRTAIYELLRMSQGIQEHVLVRADINKIRRTAMHEGMSTLREQGIRKALLGLTSVGEVLRATMA